MAEIFLSYARGDDEPFVKRLYEYLVAEGFSVWWDRVSMPSRALTFLQEIRDAIHEADRVVVVIGPVALGSDYVRAEWQHALAEAKVVIPVMRRGRRSDLPAELSRFHSPACNEGHPEAEALAEVARTLHDPIPPLAAVSGDLPDFPPHFQPRPTDLTAIAHALLLDLESPVTIMGPERMVLMHGMGGAGKSVLAAAFARSTTARRAFADGIVWLAAGPNAEPLDLVRRLGQLIIGVPQSYASLPEATTRLRERLAGRRLLFVLDNISLVEQVESLLGSIDVNTRVLATSRDAGLATAVGARAVEIRELDERAALAQLADWVHVRVDELPPAAAELARECGYLPFALALNGAMLASGVPWNDLVAALRNAELDFAEKRLANYPYPSVLKSIKVSTDALAVSDPDALVRYRELVAFDWQTGVPEPAVTMFWEHTGATSERYARKALALLASKALLRMTGTSPHRLVVLHDLLTDYLHATAHDVRELNGALLSAYRKRCPIDWPSGPADGYFHQHLVDHLARAGRIDEIHRLLAIESDGVNAWYAANDAIGNIDGYLGDIDRAAGLEKASDVLDRDAVARQLRHQLHYALLAASIRSLAGTLPKAVRTALIRTGTWDDTRGVAEASQIPDPVQRVEALIDLIPLLNGALRRRAVAEALAAARLADTQQRPRLLGLVAPFLDKPAREEVLEEALLAARSIGLPGYRGEALANLVPLVSPARKEALIAEVLTTAEEEVRTAGVNQGGFDALPLVAPYALGEPMRRLLSLIRLIPNQFMRAWAFAQTVPYVEPNEREAVAREGLALVSSDDRGAHYIYVALAHHLPEVSDTTLFNELARRDTRNIAFLLNLLSDMPPVEAEAWLDRLEATKFEHAIERIESHAALLTRLPEDRRTALVARLATDTAALEFDSWRAQAYELLAPYLSTEQLLAAKSILGTIGDVNQVASAWLELMDELDEESQHLLCDFVLERVDASNYLDVVVGLAHHTDGSDRGRTLDAAYDAFRRGASMSGGRMSGNLYEETLAIFAEMAPSNEWRVEILNAALWHIFELPGTAEWKARGFVKLVRQLPADVADREARLLLQMAQREAIERVTTSIDGETRGSRTVVANVIATLAPFLSDAVQAEAVEVAKTLDDPGWRMGALLSLAPHLPMPQRTEIVAEALKSQRALPLNSADPERNYWRPLLALADLVEGDTRSALLTRALGAALSVDAPWRARGMVEVAKRLEPIEQETIMSAAISLNHVYQTPEIAAALPPDRAHDLLVTDTLAALRHGSPWLADNMRALVASGPLEAQAELWTQAQAVFVGLKRAELAGRYVGIAPMLRSLGGPSLMSQATRSMMQALRWWP